MCKIAVIGIGGVGGYIAGTLGNTYDQVTFVARGKRKEAFEREGFRLHSDVLGELTVHPKMVVENIREAGPQDYIFICLKNYSLDDICPGLREVVTEDTVIVPIMNGVDAGERIRRQVGKGIVLDAVVYIIGYTNPDFSVNQESDIVHVHIGVKHPNVQEESAIQRTEQLMIQAGIDCRVEADIQQAVWKKYGLNCAYNVLTAYYSATTDEIRKNEKRLEEYRTILKEVMAVAEAKGIQLPENHYKEQLYRFEVEQKGDSTSSMRRDMDAKRQTELESFGGYLVREARRLQVPVPLSERLYKEMKERTMCY